MGTVSRRGVLLGAMGAVTSGALALASCGGPGPTRRSGTLTSRHWPGRDVHWQLAVPSGGHDDQYPLVVVLHGKGGDASHAFRIVHLTTTSRPPAWPSPR